MDFISILLGVLIGIIIGVVLGMFIRRNQNARIQQIVEEIIIVYTTTAENKN